ncbi:MAG TPA: prepilin-type N-terminal cleavage/methylation domain-containing protein [Acidimicrobiia bacterium]|jgi:type IV pilus assembly protein PilA|nr:prepilin-type N-terminal cleavage/methylation domain-containing protein [Acidimicrobiia bacterium]
MQREPLGARAAQPGEEGFTLLELMMVILIIAILIAVTMPVFFGASTRAKDRAMQTSLSTATTGAKSLYLGKADYTTATPAAMTAELGGVTFVASAVAPTGQNTVSLFPVNGTQLVLSGQSKTGSCFYVFDDEGVGTTVYAKLPGAGGCAANGAPLPNDPAWKSTW